MKPAKDVIGRPDRFDDRIKMDVAYSFKAKSWMWKVKNARRGTFVAYDHGSAPTKAKALKHAMETARMLRRQNTRLDAKPRGRRVRM